MSAGNYSLTITDANGCSGTNSVTIANNGIAITSNTTSFAANCAVLGTASVTATSGVTPYAIVWSNGQTGANASNLSAGNYSLTITDANGCSGTNSVAIVNNGTAINSTVSSVDATCADSIGSALVQVLNGAAPYSFNWSDGQTAATASNLTSGNYTVTIIDANGCSGQQSVTINNQNGPTLNVSATDISCNGQNNGTAIATANGGAGSYSYLWSNGQNTSSINNQSPGVYSVTVSDANNCIIIGSVTISEASAITITAVISDVSAAGGTDGALNPNISGGNPAYNFNWSNGATTEVISGLTAGVYSLTVTDANACTATQIFTVSDGPVGIIQTGNFALVNLYPNPSDNHAVLDCSLNAVSNVEIRIVDALGRILISEKMESVSLLHYEINCENWPAAVYVVQLISNTEFITKQLIIFRK